MSWSIGYDSNWKRDIGYGVPSICDNPGCTEKIDRGLGYVCGGEPYGGEDGCGLFFCSKHGGGMQCMRCRADLPPFDKTPDTPVWIRWKLTDKSWSKWRKENPEWVEANKPRDPRPTCAVRGVLGPRAMCSKVIVGGTYCGHAGECPHKVEGATP